MYLVALLRQHGISPSSAAKWDVGTIIDYCSEDIRFRKIRAGIDVPDPEKQYEQLKAITPLVKQRFESGQITEEQYKRFISRLKEYENG